MVGVVPPAGEVSGTWFEYIIINNDIYITSYQYLVVYTIVFGTPSSILIAAVSFSQDFEGGIHVDINRALSI